MWFIGDWKMNVSWKSVKFVWTHLFYSCFLTCSRNWFFITVKFARFDSNQKETLKQINFDGVNAKRCEERNLGCSFNWHVLCACFMHECKCFMYTNLSTNCCTAGKWHRDFLTNGDVVDLINAMIKSEDISNEREHFYCIIKSIYPNCSMKKYRLYEKAMKVKMTAEPRKSRRRGSSSSNLPAGTSNVHNNVLCTH